jgi:hypothetical protein
MKKIKLLLAATIISVCACSAPVSVEVYDHGSSNQQIEIDEVLGEWHDVYLDGHKINVVRYNIFNYTKWGHQGILWVEGESEGYEYTLDQGEIKMFRYEVYLTYRRYYVDEK